MDRLNMENEDTVARTSSWGRVQGGRESMAKVTAMFHAIAATSRRVSHAKC